MAMTLHSQHLQPSRQLQRLPLQSLPRQQQQQAEMLQLQAVQTLLKEVFITEHRPIQPQQVQKLLPQLQDPELSQLTLQP